MSRYDDEERRDVNSKMLQCCDNDDVTTMLTYGKIYKCYAIGNRTYCVDDRGELRTFYHWRFRVY
jgi:hypothetical protein